MKLFNTKLLSSLILSSAMVFPVGYSTSANAEEVNVYSARKTQLIKPLLDAFTRETGIKVNLITSKADALVKKLESEGRRSPADIFITTDAGRLHRAKELGLLQAAISEDALNKVPANLKDIDNQWLGLTTRARVIVYKKDKVNPSELSTYEALAEPKWKNRICIRSSDNIYNQSLVASMITNIGEQKTQQWANQFVENFARKPKGGDRDQVKAVAAGNCDIAIVNTYYLGQMLNGNDPEQVKAAQQVAVFWPNQNDRGTHINVSGIAITNSAKNVDNANKLITFLLTKPAQDWYAQSNNEYPVVANVEASDTLKSWGKFKSDSLNMSQLGINNPKAVRLMDRANWR
ncbi:Fe(3+) ABC transporter substrate-binding protein [Thiomicrorhabdus sp. Kp2]|uniref:Fe(3+) ABC transporter substrate-binding protein n=1 Tax=Thiomicrorhabdus sp. Kp2 TaxID=1123518 RepID=UPI00041520F1|nr:Fe(3+) ABC transporter substrate-binding protein [Thiomicrorhabdus sp. Kp2]